MLFKDPHGIETKKDKILSVLMIGLDIFSNLVAIYSNINALLVKTKECDPKCMILLRIPLIGINGVKKMVLRLAEKLILG